MGIIKNRCKNSYHTYTFTGQRQALRFPSSTLPGDLRLVHIQHLTPSILLSSPWEKPPKSFQSPLYHNYFQIPQGSSPLEFYSNQSPIAQTRPQSKAAVSRSTRDHLVRLTEVARSARGLWLEQEHGRYAAHNSQSIKTCLSWLRGSKILFNEEN